MKIEDLFQACEEQEASDLILAAGAPPVFRINKKIIQSKMEKLTPDKSEELIFSILSKGQQEKLIAGREINFSHAVSGLARFRANVFYQRGSVSGVFRRVPFQAPSLESLNLPVSPIENLLNLPNGLIIVSGTVGSGKSTTLAAMIEIINNRKSSHIITVEDPIEYLFKHKKSIIEQREVFSDTRSFPHALHNVLRQNPDVVLIGEMRDAETVQTALTAAETGVLVLTTLHTSSAPEVLSRIISLCPPSAQAQVRSQLASALAGVIAQRLLPQLGKNSLVLATEILINQPNIASLIRENKTHQIPAIIETNAKKDMESMDQCLMRLYRRQAISEKQFLLNLKDRERQEVKEILKEINPF